MDDAALAIGGDLAENTLHFHSDLRLLGIAYDLRRDLRPLIRLTIASTYGVSIELLLGCRVDHGERDDRAGT